MLITKRISDTLYIAKAFAILSVISAHMSFTEKYFLAETVRSSFSQIGVGVFFILSGFFYNRKPNDTKEFWLKKLKTNALPWLILSLLTFAVSIVLSGNTQGIPFRYVKYFLGIGSLYWYMSMSFVCFAAFKFIAKKGQLVVCMLISLISIYLSAFNVIPHSEWFNQYVNPLNWMGFFALGILLRKENLMEKAINIKAFIISILGLVISIAVAVLRGNEIKSYIDVTSVFVELFGFLVIINVSNFLADSKLLAHIGKDSFFIYLMHIQIAGIVNTKLPYTPIFFILRPIIVLIVCYLITLLFELIIKITRLSKFSFIFGLNRK